MINNSKTLKSLSVAVTLGCLIAAPAMAIEVLTKEDFDKKVIVSDMLVRLADNAIFLLDTSSSMNDEFRDTGMSKLEVAMSEFKERNSYFPELGHKFAIYEYTPWKEIYPLQTFDRDKVAEALENVKEEGGGPTPLNTGVKNAVELVEGLTGRTVVFLFYDGDFTGPNPDPNLWKLVKENDVCLLMISGASEDENEALDANVSRLSACSRVIPYDYFIDRPEYTTHALFDVRATEEIVTTIEERIAGVKVDNIVFGFDKAELTADDKAELDALAKFMEVKPESYAVLSGYTDNVGIEDYNEHLSQLRTEMVAAYLSIEHGIDPSRMVLNWHGSDNPIADNSTQEGRSQNRRVEVAIGGL